MRYGGNRCKPKLSLQQTTLLMLIILLIFFGMMFLIAASLISKRTEEDFNQRTSETAVNNVVSSVKAELQYYNYLSRLIMLDQDVVRYLKADEVNDENRYEAGKGIREIENLYSYIDSVYLIRNDKRYISTGQGKYTVYMDRLEKNKILEARGATVLSINGFGSILKYNARPMLTLSRAVYDIYSQKLIGILMMNISGDVFDEVLSIQNASGICILNRSGEVLCGNKKIAQFYDNDYASDEMVYKQIMIDGERKTLTGVLAADPLIVLCASAKGAKRLPRDTIYALMITLTAFIVSAFVSAWFITRNIARPIKNLSDAMERTQSSAWMKKIDTKMPNNEIGRLADSYNTMIEYLNELFNQQLENEKKVQRAEMRILQEQIKPHFLYNSLATISYMAVQENDEKVHNALDTLGSFYRNSLSKGEREIPLKRELRITKDYLALQKMRYGDIFQDEYCLDENTLNDQVPKMILQPLVENSINHGVRLKGEKCIIRITTQKKEDGLHIIVYDSGVGMSEEQIHNVLTESKEENGEKLSGFGLRGTIDRLKYNCDCEQVIQIRSRQGEYTEVELFIPKICE